MGRIRFAYYFVADACDREQNDFATHIVDEKLTAKLELVSGYMNIQNGEFAGSIEVKKMTGIGKRPRWKLRHVCTKGDCILIYSIAYVPLLWIVV